MWTFVQKLWRRWLRILSTLHISQRSTLSLSSKSGPGWHKLDRGYPTILRPPWTFGQWIQQSKRLGRILQMSPQNRLHLPGYKSPFLCVYENSDQVAVLRLLEWSDNKILLNHPFYFRCRQLLLFALGLWAWHLRRAVVLMKQLDSYFSPKKKWSRWYSSSRIWPKIFEGFHCTQ